jgi:hypothetical protein
MVEKIRVEIDLATKTYNSGDSLVVTHLTTDPPVSCLSTAERTGSAEFKILWSYVKVTFVSKYIAKHYLGFEHALAGTSR